MLGGADCAANTVLCMTPDPETLHKVWADVPAQSQQRGPFSVLACSDSLQGVTWARAKAAVN